MSARCIGVKLQSGAYIYIYDHLRVYIYICTTHMYSMIRSNMVQPQIMRKCLETHGSNFAEVLPGDCATPRAS